MRKSYFGYAGTVDTFYELIRHSIRKNTAYDDMYLSLGFLHIIQPVMWNELN